MLTFARSPTIDKEEAQTFATNRINYMTNCKGKWGNSVSPIIDNYQVLKSEADTLGYYFGISPQEYVL
jgi:hypothetical protein